MKFNKDIHSYSWRIQKGCNVEYFDGHKKHTAIVKKVINGSGVGRDSEVIQVVIETTQAEILTADIEKVRILKKKNK